jgi:hypothetical protein
MEAALAMEAAPKHTAKEVTQTRVFKLFIIFSSHVMASHFARGNGHDREVTVNLQNFPFQPNFNSITATNSGGVIQQP